MAVVNYYVDPKMNPASPSYVQKKLRALKAQGTNLIVAVQSVTLAAGDNDNSVYRIFPSIPAEYAILGLWMANDAITGFTGAEFGLYNENMGGAVSAGLFSTGISLAAAVNSLNPKTATDCFTAINPQANANPYTGGTNVPNAGARLWELAGETLPSIGSGQKKMAFDICMTATTRGANGGNVAWMAWFAQG